jgi:tRNA(Arg) A34 adenosine deaminase TadA
MAAEHSRFLELAIELATRNVEQGTGGPFGAVIVRNGILIATGVNNVTKTNDPTAHAEVVAIRNACRELKTFQLEGCDVYASCEPCPMCLAAIYWSRARAVYYANTKTDAAAAGFDDSLIYSEFALPPERRSLGMVHLPMKGARESFAKWQASDARVDY